MPPEPPHSQNKLMSDDPMIEDLRSRQDELAVDGYQPLSAHPVDGQDVYSASSVS